MLNNEDLGVFVVEIMAAQIKSVTYMRVYVAIDDLAYHSPLNSEYKFFRHTIELVDRWGASVVTALLRVKAYEYDRGVPLSIAAEKSWSTSGTHEGSYVSRLSSEIIDDMLVENVEILPARSHTTARGIQTMPGISPYIGGLRSRLRKLQNWGGTSIAPYSHENQSTADQHTRKSHDSAHESRRVADFVCPGSVQCEAVLRRRTLLRVSGPADDVLDETWLDDPKLNAWTGKVWIFRIAQGMIEFNGYESVRAMKVRYQTMINKSQTSSVVVLMASEVHSPWFWRYSCAPITDLFENLSVPHPKSEDVLSIVEQSKLDGDSKSGLSQEQLDTIQRLRDEDVHKRCYSSLDAAEFRPHAVPTSMCFRSDKSRDVNHSARFESHTHDGRKVYNGCFPRHVASLIQ
ncbi:hypothetical protein SARC_04758 [Sphaeroforma arctica JP610]|uniref:Uncharacterized protein n=1 Tax=Sphaeroforma arctica JP610 TaxID=667725 RepID=A0A0L0G1J8_9EUKA|nr:hypothetical protein SARC_04758 [Sphaeroforma arctica JP610]KNC82965.1 hypothetical protein SARC_04758 [Sphaeroforma arctica JP610]|eukprot:XP_014156867.1 hypothetical protein SARC_04758 [Sphaeroforma arctica JP610]